MDSLSLLRSQYSDDENVVVQQVDDLHQQEAMIPEQVSLQSSAPAQEKLVGAPFPEAITLSSESVSLQSSVPAQEKLVGAPFPEAITLSSESVGVTTDIGQDQTVLGGPSEIVPEEDTVEPIAVGVPVNPYNGLAFPGKLHHFISTRQDFLRFNPGGGFFFVSPEKHEEFKGEFKKPVAERNWPPECFPRSFRLFTMSLDYHDFKEQVAEPSVAGEPVVGPLYRCLTDPQFGPESIFEKKGKKKTKGKNKA